ncbi:hypothetical protein MRX96_018790 [Rhipicephalus microplus]
MVNGGGLKTKKGPMACVLTFFKENKKAMKEKIEHKRVKLKGMVKRSGRRPAPSAEEEEAAVGGPVAGGAVGGSSEGPPSYEQASTNQYSPEVQLLASSLQTKGGVTKEELLAPGRLGGGLATGRVRLPRPSRAPSPAHHTCCACRAAAARSAREVPVGQSIPPAEPSLPEEASCLRRCFPPVVLLYPCVLFYKGWAGDEDGVCVDARIYGNEARFVRRSCRPTARVVHTLQGGLLQLYLVADRDLAPGEEITIPFDFDYRHCIHRVTCACGQDDCRLHQRKTVSATSL